ncbi:hypothetical protein HOI83_03780 [Candidatus Uhrbacteria bacterium]|jgi:hypothetical protein|nr:hypothetical protein [Candidatus Uhrbacteria bacterium]
MTSDTKTAKSSAKDVFLYLLMIIMLAVGVSFFVSLLWQYITVQLPDPLDYYRSGSFDIMRNAISALVIVWPVLLLTSWMINKDLSIESAKQNIWVRKWLLYLTLFVASLTVIIDLITLMNSFLGGELTGRFFLKVLTILVVAVSVFAYYLWELRRDVKKKTNVHKIVGISSSAVVVACIIAGFFIVGTPAEQRAIRFDENRVSDLASIQGEVISYWVQKDALPESLNEITNSINGYIAPTDPDSDEPYTYKTTGDLSFQLCATFVTSQDADGEYKGVSVPRGYEYDRLGASSYAWDHEIGETCFDRTIDPDLYKDSSVPLER